MCSATASCSSLCKVQRIESRLSWRSKAATSTCVGLTAARAARARTLQPLLFDIGRGNWRRDTRWTMSMPTAAMMTEAEVEVEASKAGNSLAGAVVEGSAREVSRVMKCT
jgi:hypothetical protein